MIFGICETEQFVQTAQDNALPAKACDLFSSLVYQSKVSAMKIMTIIMMMIARDWTGFTYRFLLFVQYFVVRPWHCYTENYTELDDVQAIVAAALPHDFPWYCSVSVCFQKTCTRLTKEA